VEIKDGVAHVPPIHQGNAAMSGNRARPAGNMVKGVTKGYEEKLGLVGVGYRASVAGRKLNLALGFSHPIEYRFRKASRWKRRRRREIVIKGADKQLVGLVAAKVRAFVRPSRKGKGVGVMPTRRFPSRKQEEVMPWTAKNGSACAARAVPAPRSVNSAPSPVGAPHRAAHLRPDHRGRRRAYPGRRFQRSRRPWLPT